MKFTLGLAVLFILFFLAVGIAADPIENTSDPVDKNVSNSQTQNQNAPNVQIQSAIDKLSEAIANKLVDSIIGSNSGSKPDPTNMNNVRDERGVQARSSNELDNKSNPGFQGITCPKCGYSSMYFPYGDSSKKSIRCPSCGEIIKII